MGTHAEGAQALPVSVDEALHRTVTEMLDSPRLDGDKPSFEQLYYQTGMANPRARITTNHVHSLNIVSAVARFVWMIAGSNRLEDIAFYEAKVRDFTDDDLTVPGSSYGKRLFDAAPGLDQIRGVVERLREDSGTRQAAAVVWVPADAVRESRDIPCTFGMFFHIRENTLTMCTIMRSNNAFVLLPYNFFEFSLLGETIAATLGVPLGAYIHFAASMHVYQSVEAKARTIAETEAGASIEMPPIPGPDQVRLEEAKALNEEGREKDRAIDLATAIGQASELARLEAQLRHCYTRDEFTSKVAEARSSLNDYWFGLFGVLAAWGASKRNFQDELVTLLDELPSYLQQSVRNTILTSSPQAAQNGAERQPAQDAAATDDPLHLELAMDLPLMPHQKIYEDQAGQSMLRVLRAVTDYSTRVASIPADKFVDLLEILSSDGYALAGRAGGSSAANYEVTDDQILRALQQLEGS